MNIRKPVPIEMYSLTTLLGLHKCTMTWGWSSCGAAEVLLKPRLLWQWPPACLLLGQVFPIFLVTISHWVPVGRVGWPVEQGNRMICKSFGKAFGTVGRCYVLLKKEVSISIKLVSNEVLWNLLCWCHIWYNTVDQPPTTAACQTAEIYAELETPWIKSLYTHPTDSSSLISNWDVSVEICKRLPTSADRVRK